MILTKEQRSVLELVAAEEYLARRFYLTGGTALAEFYLHHRYSEDLDFFSEQEVHLPSIRRFVGTLQKKLKIQIVDVQKFLGLYSFFLTFPHRRVLKIDFSYYPYPCIERGLSFGKLRIDSVYDIAVNKIHTIVMKPRARDYIDIYFIVKEYHYPLHDLLMKAKAKFDWHIDPLQLATQLLKATEVSDFPRMLKKIDHRKWQQFFVNEARKLEKDIFE